MEVEQVWDTTTTDSTSEELAYFSGLKFAVPTATSQICALPLQHMLDWLLNPNGPPLVEGEERNIQGHLPNRAFALLAVPRFLYGPGGTPSPEPMIGVRGGVHTSLCPKIKLQRCLLFPQSMCESWFKAS